MRAELGLSIMPAPYAGWLDRIESSSVSASTVVWLLCPAATVAIRFRPCGGKIGDDLSVIGASLVGVVLVGVFPCSR